MPGKIKSQNEAKYLAIHKPAVLHELSGGSIPNFKSLPKRVGPKPSKQTVKVKMPKGMMPKGMK